MVSAVLTPRQVAGNSTDVTVAVGATNTVAMYQGTSVDNLLLPNGVDNFLLPGGSDFLLLSPQGDNILSKLDWVDIQLKDPDGAYQSSGLTLRHNARWKTLGPGVWRLAKPATPNEVGLQSE
jgi:hypothetical protein